MPKLLSVQHTSKELHQASEAAEIAGKEAGCTRLEAARQHVGSQQRLEMWGDATRVRGEGRRSLRQKDAAPTVLDL